MQGPHTDTRSPPSAGTPSELAVIPHVNTRWHPGSVLFLEPPEAGSEFKNVFPLSNLSPEKLEENLCNLNYWTVA